LACTHLQPLAKCFFDEVRVKAYQLAVTTCSVWLELTAAFAQGPLSSTSLTANPVYVKNCAKCHGKNGEGRHFGGPSLVSEKNTAMSTVDLRNIITNGKGHMPKFAAKLTSEEIDALVREIRVLNKK
jgi:mono/diheme cytochrome c family protein